MFKKLFLTIFLFPTLAYSSDLLTQCQDLDAQVKRILNQESNALCKVKLSSASSRIKFGCIYINKNDYSKAKSELGTAHESLGSAKEDKEHCLHTSEIESAQKQCLVLSNKLR